MLLDPGYELTLRPMKYPPFYEMYKSALKNTWSVEEIDFSTDLSDLRNKLTPADKHLIQRLVAFFATGDTIVSNNLVLNLYKHINSPEARMFLSRQLAEESLHIQFYLTLLDNYIPDTNERNLAFAGIDHIASIKAKADFAFKWIDSIHTLDRLDTIEKRKQFLLNLIAFAACIEGLFFFAAFAYVYYLRSRGLLQGLAAGTSWVFRDECTIEGTEILTPHGWVDFRELKEEQKVAQFDLETSEISFVVPSRVIKNYVENENLIEFENKRGGIHQIITKNHEIVWKWSYQKEFKKIAANTFVPNGSKMIPVSGYKKTGQLHLTHHERFLIALQADGYIEKRCNGARGTRAVSFSFKKQRKVLRMRNLLIDCGYKYTESLYRGEVTHFYVKIPLHMSITKFFKDWVNIEEISESWCEEFLEEISHWDAHVKNRHQLSYNNYITYFSNEKSNIDIVQMIGVLCGKKTFQKKVKKQNYVCYIKDIDTVRGGPELYKKEILYTGNVYCVTVPTGAIVIRYNDRVSITGNCGHMNFAFEAINIIRKEEPHLFDRQLQNQIGEMLREAVDCEIQFATDLLSQGVVGLSLKDMRQYLHFIANQRCIQLQIPFVFTESKNPFSFLELQDVQELTNFFERRVSAYQMNIPGKVSFDSNF